MSKDHTTDDDLINFEAVSTVAKLAKLSFNDSQCVEYTHSLNKILSLMECLQQFDTDGVEPLKSPFDNAQPLRTDTITEHNQRDLYQTIAPATQAGLYLVPRVIE